MYTQLLNAVGQLPKVNVLVLGDFILDSYIYGDALRISPEAPVPVLKVVERTSCCGGAGSVAADISALGGHAICIGYYGDDPAGAKLTELLSKTDSDLSRMVQIPKRPTISKERIVGLAQHKHRQQLMRIDDECVDELPQEYQDQIFDAYRSALDESDIVCLQDYGKGLLTESFTQKLIEAGKSAGKLVLVDPIVTEDYTKYRGASLITPNRKEASAAAGFAIDSMKKARQAAEEFRKKYNFDTIVITLDKEGAYLHSGEISEHVPTVPRSVYDVSGAGDMVLATLAVFLAAKYSPRIAAQLANIAGGLEVEKFGTATVSAEELINEIISLGKGKSGKILELGLLQTELEFHRNQGDTIVFTNGCFDVLHRGHIEYLKFCKKHGDILVIGLNTDRSIKANKGPSRPINNEHDRAILLSTLEMVDYVVLFDEDTPKNLIEAVCPDILVKGEDWKDKGVVGREFVESRGGKVLLAPLVKGKSSTATIEKMNEAQKKEQVK